MCQRYAWVTHVKSTTEACCNSQSFALESCFLYLLSKSLPGSPCCWTWTFTSHMSTAPGHSHAQESHAPAQDAYVYIAPSGVSHEGDSLLAQETVLGMHIKQMALVAQENHVLAHDAYAVCKRHRICPALERYSSCPGEGPFSCTRTRFSSCAIRLLQGPLAVFC
jgi:hypothetical protein